jgi:hypothetical protein
VKGPPPCTQRHSLERRGTARLFEPASHVRRFPTRVRELDFARILAAPKRDRLSYYMRIVVILTMVYFILRLYPKTAKLSNTWAQAN